MSKRTIFLVGLGLCGLVLTVGLASQYSRTFFEEPAHLVTLEDGNFEIRRYSPSIVAETTVNVADREQATSIAFRRLAAYIFAKESSADELPAPDAKRASSGKEAQAAEKGREAIAMTTPVETTPSNREPIAMTTRFTMPSEYTLDTLPPPRNSQVVLRESPARTVAALRFSGSMHAADRSTLEAELRQKVASAGYKPLGPVSIAQYDPPTWVLSPFRRNELLLTVSK